MSRLEEIRERHSGPIESPLYPKLVEARADLAFLIGEVERLQLGDERRVRDISRLTVERDDARDRAEKAEAERDAALAQAASQREEDARLVERFESGEFVVSVTDNLIRRIASAIRSQGQSQ